MKINKLGFLSLFALLGIIGLIIDKKALLGLLGFVSYFRYFFVTPDEMFIQNVRRAASIGFFSGVVVTTIAVVLCALLPSLIASNVALVSGYVVSIFFFTIALVVLELKEMRGC
ncbi:uncharacterized protein DUF3796 [Anaerobacterium chartisolvens]|uniref:Uncharacterized protein DUF3796 n=1 Tax=Anaerobacterium chartisolvens TaxID=1297424 RepID=A0A369B9H3_9FIRM|nr:DUF3796 domain-containing protein [Anaerobacterium chartisolvens]RCX17206.1 uncharacterized protein DUF3796 [Anaerobacterium chartisolvens]